VAPVLAAALDAVRPIAARKGVRLRSNVDDAVELVVAADAGRLQQAIWNLLTNAVKFTPSEGTVTATATADGARVVIAVADTGMGIDPEDLPYVFERFRQADSSTTRQHGGLGLGLALVKHIVELHGGTAAVTSDGRGKGATFVVTIPRATTEEPAARRAAPRGRARRADLTGVTVLVVDDEPDARELCATALARYGAAVETVTSAREALERADAARPDVVVADLGMPDEDGFALVRRLRARESGHGRRAVVIALTAFASLQDRRRTLESGFDAHVTKPFDPTDLALTIEGFVRSADAAG
jgi:CheY-like chemotaxis protein/anti-sigma regulatory factor (Ser/Thr protein kinase)